jgi:hypothetical protein
MVRVDIKRIKHLRILQLSNLALKHLGNFRRFVNLAMLELLLVPWRVISNSTCFAKALLLQSDTELMY